MKYSSQVKLLKTLGFTFDGNVGRLHPSYTSGIYSVTLRKSNSRETVIREARECLVREFETEWALLQREKAGKREALKRSIKVIGGDRPSWFPSNPKGKLRLAA